MDMTTLGSAGTKRNVTEEELLAVFADDKALGIGLTLASDDGSALVAIGEGFGPYILEHFPGGKRTGTHLRASDELKKTEVRDAMLDYLRGGSAWRESYSWREVEDDTEGCLAATLSPIGLAATWFLIVAGICFIVYAVGKWQAFPEGDEALWGLAGLACLIVGVGSAVALRIRRRTAASGGPTKDSGGPVQDALE